MHNKNRIVYNLFTILLKCTIAFTKEYGTLWLYTKMLRVGEVLRMQHDRRGGERTYSNYGESYFKIRKCKRGEEMNSKAKAWFVVILVAVVLVNCGIFYKMDYNKHHIDSDHIVFRVGHSVAESHPIHTAYLYAKEQLETRSNGRWKVQIYPNSSLGGDRQLLESVILNYIQASSPPAATLSGFDERIMVVDIPFIFTSRESAQMALDNELGEYLDSLIEPIGLYAPSWRITQFRHLTTKNTPVHTPDDLKGLSVRVQENPIHVAAFECFGANPTPMAFSELFTALQQGTVDAQENPIVTMATSRFYEVQKYLILSGHFANVGIQAVNQDFVNSLNDEDRELFLDVMDEVAVMVADGMYEMDEEYTKVAQEHGMEVIELTSEEKEAFIELVDPVYDLYINQFGGTQEVIDMAKKYND